MLIFTEANIPISFINFKRNILLIYNSAVYRVLFRILMYGNIIPAQYIQIAHLFILMNNLNNIRSLNSFS